MAKKQKKHSKRGGNTVITQNSPLYAFSRAMNVKTADEVREIIRTSKSRAASYANAFRLDKLTTEGTVMFPDVDMILDTIEHTRQGPAIQHLWMVVRAAMAGALVQNRTVTDITPEALTYIQSGADIFQDDVRFSAEVSGIIRPGIVCYPDGTGFCYAPTNLPVKLMVQISNERNDRDHQVKEENADSSAMVVTSFNQNGYSGMTILFLAWQGTTLADIAEEKLALIRVSETDKVDKAVILDKDGLTDEESKGLVSPGEGERLALYAKTLIYLSHIEKLNGKSAELMGVQHADVGSPHIHHIRIPGMHPGWTMTPFSKGPNVPKYGLHPYYGFLTAQIMRDTLKVLAEANAYGDLSEFDGEGNRVISDHSSAEELGVLKRWINHSTVYSVTDAVASSCLSKFADAEIKWISLLSELPSREFVLSFDDRQTFAIVAIRKMHIYVSYMGKGIEPRHIPYVSLAVSTPSNYEEPFRSILCILIHISGYYKKRREVLEERKQQVDVSRRAGSMSAHIGSKPANTKNTSEGYDIDFDQLRLFNVTERAVKAVSSKVRVSRYGWHMPTHVRQAHKHRFWVGSGSKRHLEERWVEATIINKDGEPKTRVHKVKTQNET